LLESFLKSNRGAIDLPRFARVVVCNNVLRSVSVVMPRLSARLASSALLFVFNRSALEQTGSTRRNQNRKFSLQFYFAPPFFLIKKGNEKFSVLASVWYYNSILSKNAIVDTV